MSMCVCLCMCSRVLRNVMGMLVNHYKVTFGCTKGVRRHYSRTLLSGPNALIMFAVNPIKDMEQEIRVCVPNRVVY